MIALIDGDIIIYSVGFYNDITYYDAPGIGRHHYKKDALIEAKQKRVDPKLIVKHHEANDIKHSLDGIDIKLKEVLEAVCTQEYELYLTGKDNFRDKVAVTAPYKGNRKADKPFWYKEMRQYMVEAWDAKVVDGMEADDALGIAQCRDETEETVICSIDKDLLMIPGRHYNWKKKESQVIDEEQGDYNLCMQMLTGDSTDNIIGIKGIGPKTAEKLLAGRTGWVEMDSVVEREYRIAFGKDADDRYEENSTLLWIKRSRY